MIDLGDFVLVSKADLTLRKGEKPFGTSDLQDFIEYRDLFIKYIDLSIDQYRAKLANLETKLEDVGSLYIAIDTLNILKESIAKTVENYTQHLKKEEELKKDT